MAGWSEAISSIGSGTGTAVWTMVLIAGGGLIGIILLGFILWYWLVKKKWNLKAEIKIPRSDGKLTNSEWGKASFNAKKGACFVKRSGITQRPIAIPLFDVRKYVQGDNIVTFLWLGPEDVRPVLNKSYEEYIDNKPLRDRNGKLRRTKKGDLIYERAAVMNIKVDDGATKAWKAAWESAAKQAYSLKTFFTQFQTPIAIAIVIIAVFVGFAMVWTRLGSICG